MASKKEIAEAIRDSRQVFYEGAMQDGQASFINELCRKLEIKVSETLSEDEDKNASWESDDA